MATEALGDERPALFLRKATGLVRGWNVRDSLIYAVLSTNFVTLGLFAFTYAGVPEGPAADVGGDLGDPGVVPCRRLYRAHRDHPAGGRRLRLADPDPGQRHRLRLRRHRLVVHPLAVGAHLRQHPRDPVLRAAGGERTVVRRVDRCGGCSYPCRPVVSVAALRRGSLLHRGGAGNVRGAALVLRARSLPKKLAVGFEPTTA